MKTFLSFIKEALETSASSQAKRMGLQGDGHGDWYDRQGKLVAKTVRGQLKFFSGKKSEKKENQDSNRQEPADIKYKESGKSKSPKKRFGTTSTSKSQSKTASTSVSGAKVAQAATIAPRTDIVSIAFGKFNPPTKGHKKLFKALEQASSGGNFYIFPSRTQDNKRNPLDPELKIDYMKAIFPEYSERIIDDDNFKTIFDVLSFLNQEGYTSINIVTGAERVAEIDNLTAKANGQLYQYQSINVVSAGSKDSESESSIARDAAAREDFEVFQKTMPSGVDEEIIQQLFDDLISSISKKECYRWHIAPELDWKNLRESYVFGNLFNVGTMIENCNTGIKGKIIRAGTNHLICLTEEGIMFKSWIKDVCEYTETKMNSIIREPGKPNTLVGTKGYLKYVSSMTPGAVGINSKYLAKGQKSFEINRKRK